MPLSTKMSLIVDNVVLLNLDKDTERLQYVTDLYDEHQLYCLFGHINRFSAINGYKIDIPDYWLKYETYTKIYATDNQQGAYGCYLSHYNILYNFLKSKESSILIIEDDVYFVDNFTNKFMTFYKNVPTNWDALIIGGYTRG